MRRYAAVLFILASLSGVSAGAAVPEDTRTAWPVVTGPELNVTGTDIANHSVPPQYEIKPTLIDVRVEISDTALPGPKGEMASGPRTIGFTTDPAALTILIIAIILGGAGVWYLVKRRPEEPGEGDDDGE